MKNAVVLFPGVRYSCDTPLLYYAGTVFRGRGYEKIEIDYGEEILSSKSLDEKILAVRDTVLEQLRSAQLGQYEDVVFVSKSIGTALAGWAAAQLDRPVRHIYLTPLEQTLPFINGEVDIAVGAGEDEYLDARRLRSYCAEHDIPLTMYDGVGHRLEDKADIHRTLHIMDEIGGLYERF